MAAGTTGVTARQDFNTSRGSHYFFTTTSAPDSQATVLLFQDLVILEERPTSPNVETIRLSPEDFQALNQIVMSPPKPNKALLELFKA